MKQDEIIEMARQAGAKEYGTGEEGVTALMLKDNAIEAFAKLVAAKEREACAKVCEAGVDMWPGEFHEEWNDACSDRASAIRARGEA